MVSFIQNAKDLLGQRKTLPILPASAQQIIASATDEFIELKTLARCIEEDNVISARIVGLANSSFYGQTNEITSVEEAIIRVLGLDLTRGIAIGVACAGILGSNSATGFDRERFWRSSLTQSNLASNIATNSASLADHVALGSLAGLLANIGLLAAVSIAPGKTQPALAPKSDCLRSQMMMHLGCDHRHITAALTELWTLPPQIQAVFSTRCADEWALDECSSLHACLVLADAFRWHSPKTIKDLPQTPQLIKKLGLSVSLETIAAKQEKAESGIAEIACTLATG